MVLEDATFAVSRWEEEDISATLVRQLPDRLNTPMLMVEAGSILLDGIAILVAIFLIWRSNKKRAAVGRR